MAVLSLSAAALGFALGVTAGALGEAFLLALAGAVAVALVSGVIQSIRFVVQMARNYGEVAEQLRDMNARITSLETALPRSARRKGIQSET